MTQFPDNPEEKLPELPPGSVLISVTASNSVPLVGPVLSITDGQGNLLPDAFLILWVVMLYPEDASAREDFLITMKTGTVAQLSRARKAKGDADSESKASTLLSSWLTPHGGLEAL